jgi:3'(2'), 5'-bisphosphate nucleotidase
VKTSEIPLATVKGIAVRAGDAALEIYRSQDAWVKEKSDGSPLTQADMASEQVIGAALRPLDPSIPYLSEESAHIRYATRREWRRFWLVDPLDGTKEFIKRTHEFTINIALIEDGEPVLGVIVAPAVGAVYYASKYQGAWKEQDSGQPKRLRSRLADVGGPLRIVESVSHPSPELEQFLESFQISNRLKIGSSLKFCLLAEGTADLYPRLGPTMEWDVAAGDCIYRYSAADGTPHPSPLTYNKESLRNDRFVIGLAPGAYTLPSPPSQ